MLQTPKQKALSFLYICSFHVVIIVFYKYLNTVFLENVEEIAYKKVP